MGLVHAIASSTPYVEFLEGDHIRVALSQDFGDPLGRKHAVHSQAAVHIVGHEPQVRQGFTPAFWQADQVPGKRLRL